MFAEERRSLEGVHGWRGSERYSCDPAPVTYNLHCVIALKHVVKTLCCIRALTGNQLSDCKMGWTWSAVVAVVVVFHDLTSAIQFCMLSVSGWV